MKASQLTGLEKQFVAHAEFEALDGDDKAALGALDAKARNALYGGAGRSDAPGWEPDDSKMLDVVISNPVLRVVSAVHALRDELVVRCIVGRYVFGSEPDADELVDDDTCSLLISVTETDYVRVTGFDRGGRITGADVTVTTNDGDVTEYAAASFDPVVVAREIAAALPAKEA